MDTFMDKLAQKLTAQEMIKANTAADTEELNTLKSRVEEYHECLDKLKKLIEDGAAKLDGAKVDGGEINRLVLESIAKIQEIQQDEQAVQDLKEYLNEKMENSSEGIHKECVKVYRNVQAVVVEESGKQAEAAASVESAVKKVQSKVNAVLGISIAAMVLALGGVVLQVLGILHMI